MKIYTIQLLGAVLALLPFLVTVSAQETRIPQLIIQDGHAAKVNSIMFSPNGKSVASAGADSAIKLWDISTGMELLSFVGHTGGVDSIAFSPDGTKLVSGGGDGVRFWDASTGKMLEYLSGAPTFSVAFSPNGKMLAAGDYEVARLWNLSDLKNPHVLKHCRNKLIESQINLISQVIFKPDGKGLYTRGICMGDNYTSTKFWSFEPGGRNYSNGHSAEVYKNTWETLLKTLLKVKSWETVPKEIKNYYSNRVPLFAFSFDGKIIVGSSGNSLQFWDAESGKLLHDKTSSVNNAESIALSPDERMLAVRSGKSIKLFDLAGGGAPKNLSGHSESVNSVAFSLDGKTLLSLSGKESILWEVYSGKILPVPAKKDSLPFTLSPVSATSADNKLFVSGDLDVYNLETKKKESIDGIDGEVYAVSFNKSQYQNSESGEYKIAILSYIGYKGTTLSIARVTFSTYVPIFVLLESDVMSIGGYAPRIDETELAKFFGEFPDLRRKWREYLDQPETRDGKFQFSIAESGKIKISDAKTGNELCSLMTFGESDWAVFTPEGLFDASPGARKLMAWQVGGKPGKIVALDTYSKEFYYPNLLPGILAGKTPKPQYKAESILEAKLVDEFGLISSDDKKARIDAYLIEFGIDPAARGHIIFYSEKGKLARTKRLVNYMRNYMFKTKRFDPARITFVDGGVREETLFQLYVVPAGAENPLPVGR